MSVDETRPVPTVLYAHTGNAFVELADGRWIRTGFDGEWSTAEVERLMSIGGGVALVPAEAAGPLPSAAGLARHYPEVTPVSRTPASIVIGQDGGPCIDVHCAVCGEALYEGTPGTMADLNEICDERDTHAERVHGE